MCCGAAAQARGEGHRRKEKERSKPAGFPPVPDTEVSWRLKWVLLLHAPGDVARSTVSCYFLQSTSHLGAAHPDREVGREIASPPFNR